MAVNTTIRRAAHSPCLRGSVNLTFTSTTGIIAGAFAGIGGDLAVQFVNALPNNQWKCEVTAVSRASKRAIIHPGDIVQDTTIPT